jgi:hypothetical protein
MSLVISHRVEVVQEDTPSSASPGESLNSNEHVRYLERTTYHRSRINHGSNNLNGFDACNIGFFALVYSKD